MLLLLRNRMMGSSSGPIIVDRLLYSVYGRRVISIILGFGLAMLFHKTCSGKNCTVYKAPPVAQFEKTAYEVTLNGEKKCYKYEPEFSTCARDQTT